MLLHFLINTVFGVQLVQLVQLVIFSCLVEHGFVQLAKN
jgi:hypothetical protein